MNLTRRTFLTLSSALAAQQLLGCARQETGIRMVIRTGLEADGLRLLAQRFATNHDATVAVNELGRDGYLSSVPTQLLTGSSDADVIFVPSTLVAELAAGRAIAPLDGAVDAHDVDLITRCAYAGKTYAIPTDISSMFLFYRSDLISTPPQTWDEYREIAKEFTQALNPKSPTRFGAVIPGESGEDLPKGFYNVLWSYGGDLLQDGKVAIDSAPSLEAARYYASLVAARVLPPDVTSWGFSQMFEGLLNGTVAMAGPFWNAAAPLIAQSNSPLKANIASTLVPGVRAPDGQIRRVPFQHSWTLVCNAKTQHAQQATQFMTYATGKDGARLYASKGGNPARYSILEDPSFATSRPDFALLSKSLRLARAEPNVPYYAPMHQAMNEALTRILTSSATPEEALSAAASRLRSLASESRP